MPPSATFCHSTVDLAVGPAANSRNVVGSTPSVATQLPLSLMRAASSRFVADTPASLPIAATAVAGQRLRRDHQQVSGIERAERAERRGALPIRKLHGRHRGRRRSGAGRHVDAGLLGGECRGLRPSPRAPPRPDRGQLPTARRALPGSVAGGSVGARHRDHRRATGQARRRRRRPPTGRAQAADSVAQR